MDGILEKVACFSDGRSRRISSYDRTGGNKDRMTLPAGETVDIAKISGAGIIKHLWFTMASRDPMHYRNLILRMYWDGEKKPSVQSPIGDFFGQGWGEIYPYAALPICVGEQRALNCYFAMPFSDGARIEIENDGPEECRALYYYVDYEERDSVGPEMARFHAQWRRSCNLPPEGHELEWGSDYAPEKNLDYAPAKNLTDAHNHAFIEAEGRGQYVGVNYYVDNPGPLWYGEGDDMFVIDGKPWPPAMHGTGTEDYFCSSYCPKKAYCHPYFGYPRVNNNFGWLGRTHCYRFHIEDPVLFTKSLRGSIETGHANGLLLDLITVAYWYQSEPHKPFAALPGVAGRANMPPIGARQVHEWRETWRQAMGGGKLWGTEGMPRKLVEEINRKSLPGRKSQVPPKNVRTAKAEMEAEEKMYGRRRKRGK